MDNKLDTCLKLDHDPSHDDFVAKYDLHHIWKLDGTRSVILQVYH